MHPKLHLNIVQFSLVAAIALLTLPSVLAHEAAEVLTRTTKSWDGKTLPAYPTEQPEVTILKVTVPPKSKLPWHKHLVINAGYMISGELTVVSENGDSRKLKAGDTLVELVGTYHYGKNDGDTPAVIVVFYAGSKGETITELKDPAPAPQP
jgi:quercetin dioxygenase-like cupin family protein